MSREVHDGDQLVDNLRVLIDHATDRAWDYAQLVGWHHAYPLLSQEITEPLTRDSIRKTYEAVTQQMYRTLMDYMNKPMDVPDDRVAILWCNYADFTGAVLVYPDRNPSFKFGILW